MAAYTMADEVRVRGWGYGVSWQDSKTMGLRMAERAIPNILVIWNSRHVG